MAPKNQGIMTVDPFLAERLVGKNPKILGLGELIDKNTRGYTDDEFFGRYGAGTINLKEILHHLLKLEQTL